MSNLIYKEEVYAIIGAAMDVHNELGVGFLEAVYQEALEVELASRSIPFSSQPLIPIHCKNQVLKKTYIADLLVFEKIIVEIKAIDRFSGHDEVQLLNYLKATDLELGLLINFGAAKLEWKRLILSSKRIGEKV